MAERTPSGRLPNDQLPTFEELLERVERLEAAPIKLKDLPLSALQSKLESDWQPDPGLLLGASFVALSGLLRSGDTTSALDRAGGANITTSGAGATLNAGIGISSVSRVAVGRYNVILPFSASAVTRIHPVANVVGGGAAAFAQGVATSASPAAFDVYTFNAAGAAVDGLTFNVIYLARALT